VTGSIQTSYEYLKAANLVTRLTACMFLPNISSLFKNDQIVKLLQISKRHRNRSPCGGVEPKNKKTSQ
jgi:hypothetical protein